MSYAVHYDLSGRGQDSLLQDFSHMRIEAGREPPVLYVAMASWIPKCNMYHHKYVFGVVADFAEFFRLFLYCCIFINTTVDSDRTIYGYSVYLSTPPTFFD